MESGSTSERAPGSHISLGRLGEQYAAQYLCNKGYLILEQNWRTSWGELDLICRFKSELVFVEVKTRKASPLAEALLFETITPQKLEKLRKLIEYYCKTEVRGARLGVRLEAVGVLVDASSLRLLSIEHLENVV